MRAAAREYALTRTWELAMQPLYRAYLDVCVRRAPATPAVLPRLDAHVIRE
jgi:hypothetical protein